MNLSTPSARTDTGRFTWLAYLKTQLDTDWRPDEWFAKTWTFYGDPENATTRIYRCEHPGCTAMLRVPNQTCDVMRRLPVHPPLSGLKRPLAHPDTIPQCSVTSSGDRRCARKAWQDGLCLEHLDLPADHRNPLAASEECQTLFCHFDVKPGRSHCPIHFGDRNRAGKSIRLQEHMFSFEEQTDLFRLELLVGLQDRDLEHQDLNPAYVRWIISDNSGCVDFRHAPVTGASNIKGLTRDLQMRVARRFNAWSGVDLWADDVWDGGLLRIPSNKPDQIAAKSVFDFRTIRVPWMRTMVKEWAHDQGIKATRIQAAIQAFSTAADIAISFGHREPSEVGQAEMTATVQRFATETKPNGAPYSPNRHQYLVQAIEQVIEHAQTTGSPPDLSARYSVNKYNRPRSVVASREEETGRALPESIIRVLDAHLHLLRPKGEERRRAGWTNETHGEMLQIIYQVQRDTGRRPGEVTALRKGCVITEDDGSRKLIYNNTKSGRHGRSLPIDESTAKILMDWEKKASLHSGSDMPFLFMSPGLHHRQRQGHVNAASVAAAIKLWVDAIPHIPTSETDDTEFPRSRIVPYAFRHSYAQRHADAGTPIDVLQELMDHRSPETTFGYYRVSMKKKQEALGRVAKYMANAAGPVQGTSRTQYERQTVTVPFGSCSEPHNVKAGGQGCVMAFKCAGCMFFKSDPSFLPELQVHIGALRKQVESAVMFSLNKVVLEGMRAELDLFISVRDSVQEQVDSLNSEDRSELDGAVSTLRKVRSKQTFLPMPTVRRRDPSE